MSGVKSTKELADEFVAAYEQVRPSADAFRNRIKEMSEQYRKYRRANNWFKSEKFGFLENFHGLDISVGNIMVEDGYYFEDDDNNEYIVTFEEMDDFLNIIKAEYDLSVIERAESDARFVAQRRAALEAELAALDKD